MKIPKRLRGVLWAIGFAFLFSGVSIFWVFAGAEDAEVYVPGQLESGLSSSLSRSLPEDTPEVVFTDVTESSGISFRHFPARRTSRLPEDMGSGAAWGDYDGDGWMDLYVVNMPRALGEENAGSETNEAHSRLYHNLQNGTFEEVSKTAGVAFDGMAMGASWADYDNDGRLDLFVTAYGHNRLYRNRGDGTFEDVSKTAGVFGPEGFWVGAAWGDYDRDGHVDLYVTGYVDYVEDLPAGVSLQYDVESPAAINPSSFAPIPNLLYRNRGNGTFEEVAIETGVSNDRGRSLSAVWVDLNRDGLLDLYVANDVSDNVLYINRGDGLFEDRSYQALVADYRGAMGIATADWNGDGDVDLFVTHWIAQENALYENTASGTAAPDGRRGVRFMDVADRFGVGQIALDFVGWATGFTDYDNDGLLDLFVVNGSTLQKQDAPQELVPMRDQLFWNRGPEDGFFDVSTVAGDHFSRELVGRGAAAADYDRDGDMDLFIVNHGDKAVLLRNDGGNRQNWLQVHLDDDRGASAGYGATIRVVAGPNRWIRQVGAQGPYASQHSPVEHFGLGQRTKVDSVIVDRVTGERQVLTGVPVNRRIKVTFDRAL